MFGRVDMPVVYIERSLWGAYGLQGGGGPGFRDCKASILACEY